MSDPATIMTVHAHPDDEASKGAPTLAKYKAAGVRTVLVCCTGGEEGDLQNPTLREPGQPFHDLTPEQERELVVSMRPAELQRSAEVIGFDAVEMLGYRDSGMADSEPNEHPDCFHQADVDEATGRLVSLIRRHRPQVLITYNDDQAGYPHPDHLRVHEISVLAFERAGDPEWYPELGEPFQPLKLYYSTWSRKRLVAVHEGLLKHRGESPFDDKWFERPDTDHRVTTRIEVGDFMWA
ncbi:MAG: mycothiol conjugate amidase Mca, partial [Ilumatobacter sp.]|nr:mycothiol conjugate amidase Mca [Ilumatobacter sp.]